MRLFLLLIISLLVVIGCGKHAPEAPVPVVETETWEHEPLTMQEPTPTGARGDIPAGVDASDVVSQVTFSHAGGALGKITTVKENKGLFRKPKKEAYLNCANCHGPDKQAPTVPLKAETPRDAWWTWPVYIVLGGFILFVLIKLFPVLEILRRFIPFKLPWG